LQATHLTLLDPASFEFFAIVRFTPQLTPAIIVPFALGSGLLALTLKEAPWTA
jgi:hypothetical protein